MVGRLEHFPAVIGTALARLKQIAQFHFSCQNLWQFARQLLGQPVVYRMKQYKLFQDWLLICYSTIPLHTIPYGNLHIFHSEKQLKVLYEVW
jgi:hypothetical protein